MDNIYGVNLKRIKESDINELEDWITYSDYNKHSHCPFFGCCKDRCYEIFSIYKVIQPETLGKCPCHLFGVPEVSRIANLLLQYNINDKMHYYVELIKDNCNCISDIYMYIKKRKERKER